MLGSFSQAELIWRHIWPTRDQVTKALFQYIYGFYNIRRKTFNNGRSVAHYFRTKNRLNENRMRI